MAEVSIKVEDKYGNVSTARAAGEDIVIASVQAMINGLNRIMLKRTTDKDTELRKYTV